jgi:hypothetical protein
MFLKLEGIERAVRSLWLFEFRTRCHTVGMFATPLPEQCSCGNIHFSGEVVDLRGDRPIVQIQNGSIGIRHFHLLDCHAIGRGRYQVRCLGCRDVATLDIAHGLAYAQFAQQMGRRWSSGDPAAPPTLIGHLFRADGHDAVEFGEAVRAAAGDEDPAELEDGDFKLMFSNTEDIFVGAARNSCFHELLI